MEYPIDLGKTMGEGSALQMISKDDTYYPSIHISGKESIGLPESGLMTVRFKRVSESHSEHNGKESYDCTLDIKEIVSVKPDKKAEPDEEDTGSALDRLKEEVEKEEDYD